MITIKQEKRFTTSDGKKHDSLREAQINELEALFKQTSGADAVTAATLCVQHAEKVLDVLTTNENSLPKARAVNGGKKPRKPRVVAAQPALSGTSEPVTQSA